MPHTDDQYDISMDGYNPDPNPVHDNRPSGTDNDRQKSRKSTKTNRPRKSKETETRRRTNETERRRNPVISFFTDDRTRLFSGILMMVIGLTVAIVTISHFRHGGNDQSHVINATISEMSEEPGAIGNMLKAFGAWLSHVLLTDTLGIGSLVLIAYCWILGIALLGFKKCHFWSLTFKCLLIAITASVVIGLITYDTASEIYWGGNHGHYVNKFLIDTSGVLGALSVSIVLVAAVICVYINDINRIWRKWREQVNIRKLQEQLYHHRGNRDLEDIDVDGTDEEKGPENNVLDNGEDIPIHVTLEHDSDETTSNDGQDNTFFSIDNPDTTDTDIKKDETFEINAPEIEEASSFESPRPDIGLYDHRADLSRYKFPDIDLLEDRPSGPNVDMTEQQDNKDRIVKTLLDYKIPIAKIEATVGPTVTLYEIVPAEGVRIAQIKRLEDDIALSLSALGIRIIAPIPGKGTVGIEVPNRDPQTVSMRSIITSRKFQECKMSLPMAMGATISNDIFIEDLTKMPHLLVAGATGQGKSVGLNAIIASLLYKKHPSELKFVLVDPKMVEFSLYSKLERHYLAKLPDEDDAIITDPAKVIQTLNSLCVEMDNRYALLRKANVRSLEEYNRKFSQRKLNPENGHKYLPYIVVIVDEFADLIMTAGKEVEMPIARIAQKARAVGMHMIIATQRPSTNVITGIIKANFPGRIAFRVSQMVDSKTILDRTGANQLIGRGDMLFSHNGKLERVQCAYISTEEVEAITESIDSQIGYDHAYYLPEFTPEVQGSGSSAGNGIDRDPLFDEAARFIVSQSQASTSSLQRRYSIGYNRAGKLMDQMEASGIVGPASGAKPRAVLVDSLTLERILENK